MIDYYTVLNLDRKKRVDEINADLSRLESIWKRREITNPEKATTILAYIIQARKAFASEVSRREYDFELAKSKQKPVDTDPNASRNLQFQKWYADVRSYFDNKQYDLAKTATERALSFYDYSTDNDEFLSLVADVYRMNQNYPTALDYINKAIVTNPQNAMHYILKAGIYRAQASSMQSYGETDQLIQNARNALMQSINIAHRQNDRNSESAACGLLAYYYYFVPSPDGRKAEEYATKSVDLGNVWGNASKVLDDIMQKREQEAKAEEDRKRRQEQIAKEEQVRKERMAEAEREQKQKERLHQTLRKLYNVCWIAFFGWFAFVLYSMFRLKDAYGFNVELSTAVFLIIIASWNMLEKLSDAYSSAPKIISFIFFGGYLFGAGTIKYTQWGFGSAQAARTWKYVGMNALVLVIVILIFSLIGKAIRKNMK